MMKPESMLFIILAVALAAGITNGSAQGDGMEIYIIGFDIAQGSPQEANLNSMAQQMGGIYLSAENAKTPDDLAKALGQAYKGQAPQSAVNAGQTTATVEIEPNNEIGDATRAMAGQSISGRIFPSQDTDFYRVNLPSQGILRAKLAGVPKDMKTRIDLYGKNFNRITQKDAENPSNDVTLAVDIGSPGWYYLDVSDLNGGSYSTNYTFTADFEPVVDFEPNSEIGDATEIKPNEAVKGYIFPGGDTDFYKVYLNSSGIMETSLIDVPAAIAASMKGRIDLYGKNCNRIAQKDAENPGDDAILTVDIGNPGWYYLGVSDWNGRSYNISYTLKAAFKQVVDQEPNNEIGDASAIQPSEAVKGYIFPAGDVDFYKVYVPSAGPLEAKLADVPKSIKASMKGRIDFYGKNGNRITQKDAENQGDDVTLKVDIIMPGWYYLGVSDLNGGSYGIVYTFKVSS